MGFDTPNERKKREIEKRNKEQPLYIISLTLVTKTIETALATEHCIFHDFFAQWAVKFWWDINDRMNRRYPLNFLLKSSPASCSKVVN